MVALYIVLGVLAATFTLYLFLIGARSGKGLGRLARVKYAHRGLHGDFGEGYAAENSMTAFSRAVEHGFGIELDVRFSKDGEVVVYHDDTLKRVSGIDRRVDELTREELSRIKLSDTEDTVPTFREVLSLVAGRVPLLVEIKTVSGASGLGSSLPERVAELLSDYSGEYIVESFSPPMLSAIKKRDSKIFRGFLCTKLTDNDEYKSFKYRIVQRHFLNFMCRPHFIASDFKRSKMFPIPLIRALFRPAFIAWTVRSEEEEREAYRRGFSTVIFEKYIPEKTTNE